MTATPDPDLPNGGVLGEYDLIRKLGQGGFGAVYQARHRRLKRFAAIKVLTPIVLDSPGALDRFGREMEAIARLDHPNLVRAFDAGEVAGVHFLVMEFLEGNDLARELARHGPLPVAEACRIAAEVADGLQHAHEHGLVHRDLKPPNIYLARRPDGSRVAKVLDLGLARLQDASSGGPTGSGQWLGTPDFMAPEQINDARSVDIRADLYALGCTLHHMLAGQPPFHGGTLNEKLGRHLYARPPRLIGLRPDVPPALADLVERLMAKAPEGRPATPAEVAAALRPLAGLARPGGPAHPWPAGFDADAETPFHTPPPTRPPSSGPTTPADFDPEIIPSSVAIIDEGPPKGGPPDGLDTTGLHTPPPPTRRAFLGFSRRQWVIAPLCLIALVESCRLEKSSEFSCTKPESPASAGDPGAERLKAGSWKVTSRSGPGDRWGDPLFADGSVWTFEERGHLSSGEVTRGGYYRDGKVSGDYRRGWRLDGDMLVLTSPPMSSAGGPTTEYRFRYGFPSETALALATPDGSPAIGLGAVPRASEEGMGRPLTYGFWASLFLGAVLAHRGAVRWLKWPWLVLPACWVLTVVLAVAFTFASGLVCEAFRETTGTIPSSALAVVLQLFLSPIVGLANAVLAYSKAVHRSYARAYQEVAAPSR